MGHSKDDGKIGTINHTRALPGTHDPSRGYATREEYEQTILATVRNGNPPRWVRRAMAKAKKKAGRQSTAG